MRMSTPISILWMSRQRVVRLSHPLQTLSTSWPRRLIVRQAMIGAVNFNHVSINEPGRQERGRSGA